MQMSAPTQRLCDLLAQWPRQELIRWLAEQPSPLQALSTNARPPESWRRKTPNDRFTYPQLLSRPLQDFPHRAVGIYDCDYPAALKNIPDPPLVLFSLGRLHIIDTICVSVVGARRCTTLGKAVAQTMAAALAAAGCCVVSGLALGIDTAAHRGALETAHDEPRTQEDEINQRPAAASIRARPNPVRTAAVLGSGFGCLYPRQNRGLAKKILEAGGLILSEYPADMGPRPYQFPERNRLISGLSSATVLVEAGERSGSLITARLALEQGRDVCAVPGSPISPVSRGCHRLIRQGAALVTCAQDVLEELGAPQIASPKTAGAKEPGADQAAKVELSKPAASVLDILVTQALQFDEVLARSGMSAQQVSQSLIELQLVGFVRQGPDGYIRVL